MATSLACLQPSLTRLYLHVSSPLLHFTIKLCLLIRFLLRPALPAPHPHPLDHHDRMLALDPDPKSHLVSLFALAHAHCARSRSQKGQAMRQLLGEVPSATWVVGGWPVTWARRLAWGYVQDSNVKQCQKWGNLIR